MTEYEAYRKWHAQERAIHEYRQRLRGIELSIEGLEIDMLQSLLQQCIHDKAFKRALNAFTGHTQYGWETACGVDYRLIKLCRRIGWDKMFRLIKAVRRAYGEGA